MNTSASRLADVIERVMNRSPRENGAAALQDVFGAKTKVEVLRRVGELAALVEQVEREVRALPEEEEPDHLLEHLPQIRTFTESLLLAGSVPMENIQRQASREAIYSLRSCAAALRRNGKAEPRIPEEAAQVLIGDVRRIMEDVIAGDFERGLKVFLLDRLRAVETALLNIRVTGYPGVEIALDALTSGALRQTEGGTKERSRVGEMLSRLWSSVTGAAEGTQALSATAAQTIQTIQAITGN
ncbi:hypothetical protein [Micromonospora zamorensis]|uniref:hypothetical protein n=1 Tax=Micromonospora zamorensis TaxID=709883 RepID=UPI0033A37BEB